MYYYVLLEFEVVYFHIYMNYGFLQSSFLLSKRRRKEDGMYQKEKVGMMEETGSNISLKEYSKEIKSQGVLSIQRQKCFSTALSNKHRGTCNKWQE